MRTHRKLVTRRNVLTALGAAIATGALPRMAWAAPVDDVFAVPAVDMHSHAGGVVIPRKGPFNVAERMRQGHFGIVTMSVVSDLPLAKAASPGAPVSQYRTAARGELFSLVERQLGQVADMVRRYDFAPILKSDDIATAYAARKPGLIMSVEGGDFLEGKLERVKWAYDRGVRHFQLVHYSANDIGDIMTADPVHRGLTDFGAKVVQECNRLGMIVDVAHCSADTAARVVEISATPVVLSHGGISDTPRPNSRNISSAVAQAIFAKSGMMGLWPFGPQYGTMEVWAGALVELVKRVGADHIGIGTDMEGGINEVFSDYASYPKVVETLLAKGLSVAEVQQIAGGNYLRVLKAVEAAKA